jgi:hypothetical protein
MPHVTATTSAAPTATVGQETPDAMAQASDAADVPALPLGGVVAQDKTEAAT